MRFLLIFIISLFLFTSCYTVEKFYKGETLLPKQEYPDIIVDNIGYKNRNHISELVKSFLRKGYVTLGESSWRETGNFQNYTNEALEFGKKIGADLILYFYYYLGSETLTVYVAEKKPDKETTVTTTGGVFGTGGSAWGVATTKTKETGKIEYVPETYQVSKYDFDIFFCKKIDTSKLKFGFLSKPISDEYKKILEKNFAEEITLIYENTPAYNYNLLEGDIILKINNITVLNEEQFYNLLNKSSGRIKFTLYRNNKIIEKRIRINE